MLVGAVVCAVVLAAAAAADFPPAPAGFSGVPAVLPAPVAKDGSRYPGRNWDAQVSTVDVLRQSASEPHLDSRVGAQSHDVTRAETLHLADAFRSKLLQEGLVR